MHTAILLAILSVSSSRPQCVHELSNVQITVLNTWEVTFTPAIQDIAWSESNLIVRSNEHGVLYILDGNFNLQGTVELPAGLDGFGIGYSMESEMYFVNSGSTPTIYYSDGSDSWTGIPNPAGVQGAGLDVENLFLSHDLCQVTAESPWLLWVTDMNDLTSESFILAGIDGEVSGVIGHAIMTDYGQPGGLIVTTRYGCEFFFYYEQSSSYVLYDQEDCPQDVAESLGLAWKFNNGTVLWSWKGTDGKYYVSELLIPVFGSIEDNTASTSSGGLLGILANPARSGAVLTVNLPGGEQPVSLAVFDLSGRLVETLYRGSIAVGESQFGFQAPPGIYTARLNHPLGRETLRFAVTE